MTAPNDLPPDEANDDLPAAAMPEELRLARLERALLAIGGLAQGALLCDGDDERERVRALLRAIDDEVQDALGMPQARDEAEP